MKYLFLLLGSLLSFAQTQNLHPDLTCTSEIGEVTLINFEGKYVLEYDDLGPRFLELDNEDSIFKRFRFNGVGEGMAGSIHLESNPIFPSNPQAYLTDKHMHSLELNCSILPN